MQLVMEEWQCIVLQHGLCDQMLLFFQISRVTENPDQQKTLEMEIIIPQS